jgi:hypothetical protein
VTLGKTKTPSTCRGTDILNAVIKTALGCSAISGIRGHSGSTVTDTGKVSKMSRTDTRIDHRASQHLQHPQPNAWVQLKSELTGAVIEHARGAGFIGTCSSPCIPSRDT